MVQSPVHVLSGRQDERCNPEIAKGWSNWASKVEYHEFNDGHMFILSESEPVAKLVQRILNNRVLV